MLRLRHARPGDEAGVARVHVRSWQAGYRGLMPDAYLDALRPEDRAAVYRFGDGEAGRPRTVVALDAGDAVVGFATTAPARDADGGGAGELMALYVDPDRWGTGAGRLLIRRARDDLRGLGHSDALLWVLDGNDRAQRFYRRDGWRPDGTRRRDVVWGLEVDEVRYRRRLDGPPPGQAGAGSSANTG